MVHRDPQPGEPGSTFTVSGMSPEAFVAAAHRTVTELDLGVKVEVALERGQLVVTLRRLGTSVLRYDLEPLGGGFVATLSCERLAPLHAPFRRHSETVLAQVLGALGGGSPSATAG